MIETNEFLTLSSHLSIKKLEKNLNNNNTIHRQKRYVTSNNGASQCAGINHIIYKIYKLKLKNCFKKFF